MHREQNVMNGTEKIQRLLKALGDKSRLQILECLEQGIVNPGKISKNLDRHRSTIEKHLRVLLKAGIVQKIPSLTKEGNLSINYKITEPAARLLAASNKHAGNLVRALPSSFADTRKEEKKEGICG
jgi:DNA-binding transcriptional ArsR family regulator